MSDFPCYKKKIYGIVGNNSSIEAIFVADCWHKSMMFTGNSSLISLLFSPDCFSLIKNILEIQTPLKCVPGVSNT